MLSDVKKKKKRKTPSNRSFSLFLIPSQSLSLNAKHTRQKKKKKTKKDIIMINNGKALPSVSGFVDRGEENYASDPSAHHYPSFSEVLRSDDSIATKAKSLYVISVAGVRARFHSVRPWTEFFDRDYFSKPGGTTDVINRLNNNIPYFYSNYLILCLVANSYILLVNLPFSICCVALALFYFYVREKSAALVVAEGNHNNNINSNGGESDGKIYFTSTHGYTPFQLYLVMVVFGVLAFYFTNGSSVIFWICFVSLSIIIGHGSFRRPPLSVSNQANGIENY